MTRPTPDPTGSADPLAALLAEAVAGRPPAADGGITTIPMAPGHLAAVLAFGGHHVIVADLPDGWVEARLAPGDLSGPLAAPFLDALGTQIGRRYDNLDLVLAAPALPGDPPLDLAPVAPDPAHPRVARALRYRTAVRTWQTPDGAAVLAVGRGLGGRWEVAFEVDPAARGAGLGRRLVTAARHLVPVGETVVVQVPPGNVASLRAVLAAGGWTPLGGEVLFP